MAKSEKINGNKLERYEKEWYQWYQNVYNRGRNDSFNDRGGHDNGRGGGCGVQREGFNARDPPSEPHIEGNMILWPIFQSEMFRHWYRMGLCQVTFKFWLILNKLILLYEDHVKLSHDEMVF